MDADKPLRGTDLASNPFTCCPNVDPCPFKCATCGHPMVYCDECDSVYLKLGTTGRLAFTNANGLDPSQPALSCPACGSFVEWRFRRNPAYAITRGEWLRAGLGGLLADGTSDVGR